MKTVGKQQIFESANVLVGEVTRRHQHPDQPEAARPSQEALLKMCNRSRKCLRPEEPKGLDFEVCFKLPCVLSFLNEVHELHNVMDNLTEKIDRKCL